MASLQGVMSNLGLLVSPAPAHRVDYEQIYNENCHRVYSLSFWMTDNELVAEQVAANTFFRVYASSQEAKAENVDQAWMTEMREMFSLGTLTLNATAAPLPSIRGNMKRIHLERAVIELPATEKLIFLFHDVEGYDHDRISRLLGISQDESKFGLHQARVRIRELVSQMR